jgi:hypothetical protein
MVIGVVEAMVGVEKDKIIIKMKLHVKHRTKVQVNYFNSPELSFY